MNDDPRELALRWFEEIWNQGRAETIDEMWADGGTARIEGQDGEITREQFKQHHSGALNAIDGLRIVVEDLTVDGNKAVVSWVMTGRHTGEGFGTPPSGRKVRVHGVTWLEFEEGKMVYGFDKWNRGEVLQSLSRVSMDEIKARHGLTEREAQVALLLADRRTDKEIARDLEIRVNTARRHSSKVLRKLKIHRREDVAGVLKDG